MVRRRVIVHGRVQGVFFRDTARREAEARGVAGSARNREDGTVDVILEGAAEAVEAMVRFCERGPSRAEVTRVETFEESPEGLAGFRVG